jgi:integrase/recombinase XerD
MKAAVTLYLDTRREKSDKKYPIKLRIYFNGLAKHYRTGIDVTEDEFFNAYQSQKNTKGVSGLENSIAGY